jgi:hypothetical protein
MEVAPTAARQFYILSYWLVAGIWAFPSGFPIPMKNCLEAFQIALGISQQLSYTLLAMPNRHPTAFRHFPVAVG